MLGYSREELFDRGPMDLMATSRAQLEVLYDAIIAGRRRTGSMETAAEKTAPPFPVEVHRQAHRAGADWIIVTVMRDVTERVESQSRLKHLVHFDASPGC